MPRPKAERPKFSLTRRGSRYYVQWWEAGTARRVSCRTEVLAEARRFLAEFQAARDTPQAPAAPTLGQILDGYQADRGPKAHSPTLGQCCDTLRAHLGDLPVDLLADEQVRGYVAARRKEGSRGAAARYRAKLRPLSDGTLVRELGVLRAALAWAVKKRWITSAPHVQRPSAPPPRDRWLTPAEAERLIAGTRRPHVRLFVLLALQTAARTGAILELTWEQVDLAAGRIAFGRSRGRKRRATVPFTGPLAEALAEAVRGATSEYVIEHGGSRVESIKTGFRAACRRARLAGVTPHVMRHTAATWMVQRGVPLAMVAAYLGNSVQMVERVYGHHSPEWLAEAAAALSRPLAERTAVTNPPK